MVSRNPEDRDMPLSRESIKSSSETEEDQSATIPTSSVTDPFKNKWMPSKKEQHDHSSYLNPNPQLVSFQFNFSLKKHILNQ